MRWRREKEKRLAYRDASAYNNYTEDKLVWITIINNDDYNELRIHVEKIWRRKYVRE